MSAGLRPLQRLLIDSVRPGRADRPLGELVGGVHLGAVVSAGAEHRVTPALARRMRHAPDAPEGWSALLERVRTAQLVRHMRASEDLRILSQTLADGGVPWAVAKGPVAADLIWPSPDMREYYDVDVFVDRHEFPRALELLLAAGCSLVDRNWPELRRTMRAELALKGPAGTHIDLHWDMAVPPKLRSAFRTDMRGMLARSRPATLGSGVGVRVFDPVDTVLHLVFHAAQAGANRLMWIADIHHATALPDFDWGEFAERSAAARTRVPAALVLDRVSRCLGFRTPPPEAVLAPAARFWGALVRRKDDSVPFPGLPGDRHLGGVLFSSARDTVTASAVEAAISGWRTRRTERRVDRHGPEERVLYQDVPDVRARRAYLAAVSG
ncbi:nucleotidyltransferase family protein [Gryllotalpicola ginsengisoli]|uniref:nucleotidyltransferase family protein n=1 Tax=Gryllotalpicola ginsengisoli TaxID=444608 RepID=UPI0003B75B1A|nr:nucleotidyltransferase family protein [Gryllotalpicola ginsengisoli]